MNYNDLQNLTNIYNTLLLVSTRGEDTVLMGNCLTALRNFVLTKKEEFEKNQNTKAEEG